MRTNRMSPILLAVLLLSGCLTGRINNTMNSWMGSHYSQLLMSWGPPQQVFEDGTGGRILVYTSSRQWTTPGQITTTTTGQATVYDNMIWGQAQSFTQFSMPQTRGYVAWRAFAIDKDGRVYNYSWRGL